MPDAIFVFQAVPPSIRSYPLNFVTGKAPATEAEAMIAIGYSSFVRLSKSKTM